MKILVISQYWYPENGVPQRRWSWLAGMLVEQGHEVTVIAPPPHYNREVSFKEWWENRKFVSAVEQNVGPAGERIVRSGFFPAGKSLSARALSQAVVALGGLWVVVKRPGILKGYSPDVVIGTVPALPTAVVTQMTARLFGVPFVIDLRDAWPDLLWESHKWNAELGATSMRQRVLSKGPWQVVRIVTQTALNSSLRNASAILTTSSDFADSLRRRPRLVADGRVPEIYTVRNLFPTRTSFHKQQVDKREVGNSNSRINVLYAGTLGRAQDLSNALYAADWARDEGVEVSLRFVGAGAARSSLRDLARKLKLDVEFLPRAEADELDVHYKWADTALVHLAPWKPLEMTVPSKLYELMSVGMHISGVLAGEASQLLEKLHAGDVVAPGDPAALGALWKELAENHRKFTVGEDGRSWIKGEARDTVPIVMQKVLDGILKHPKSRTGGADCRSGSRLSVLITAAGAMALDDPRGFVTKAGEQLRQGGQEILGTWISRVAGTSVTAESSLLSTIALGKLRGLPESSQNLNSKERRAVRRAKEKLTLLQKKLPNLAFSEVPAGQVGSEWKNADKDSRVLFFLTNSLPFTQSGYTLRSHHTLRALSGAGVDVIAVTRLGYPVLVGKWPARKPVVYDGIRYSQLLPWVYPKSLLKRWAISRSLLANEARRFDATILHTTTDYNNALVVAHVAKDLGLPWVYEVRGELEKTWLSRFTDADKAVARASDLYELARGKELESMKAASAVVVLSEVSKKNLVARGVEGSKIWVIPNAVDAELVGKKFDKSSLRVELGVEDAPTVGIITSVVRYEGIDDLLRAAAHSKFNVLVVGDGVELPRLKTLASELGINERVVFTGRQPADSIWKWYACLDVFVLPRKDEEVCRTVTPIKALVAQAIGIPVVASDLPAIREITGGYAEYSSPSDPRSLARAIENQLETPMKPEAGIAWAQEHTWESNAKRYAEMYRHILNGFGLNGSLN